MRPSKLILIIGWTIAMNSLDSTIIMVANPNIQVDPGFVPSGSFIPTSTIQWVNVLYSIAFGAFSIPAAKAGDRFGVTNVIRLATLCFVVFSVLCGISHYITYDQTKWTYGGFYILLAARFFQGASGAFCQANTIAASAILVE